MKTLQNESKLLKTRPKSFHDELNATMSSNDWPYPYALGYIHGKDDRLNNRPRDVTTSDKDDFAKGYSLGYFRAE